MKYKLSFCIPEYNNSDLAFKLVTQLLENPDDRFQVVVLDDASTDDTFERLKTLKDTRFKLFRNKTNLGAKKTWCRVLEHGEGEWLYLVMGRDQLDASKIGILIDRLEFCSGKNVGCIADRKVGRSVRILNSYDSAQYFLKFGEHPTGTILNREAFFSIKNRKKYFQFAFAYPEIYVKRDILSNGYAGAIINSDVYTAETGFVNIGKVVSSFEKNKKVLYWYPQRQTEQFIHVLKMTEYDHRFHFKKTEYDTFFLINWKNLINKISYNWKRQNEDKIWTAHYGKECRTVAKKEMLCNILSAYKTVHGFYRLHNWNMSFKRHLQMLFATFKMIVHIIFDKNI